MLETIATPRLVLEPFTEADLDDLHALNRDPTVMRFLDGVRTREQSAGELGRILALRHEDGHGAWVMRTKHTRAFVGRVGIKPAPGTNEHELLYAVGQAFWRQGLASEAAAAVLARTFAFGVARVIAAASPENEASIAVMKRIGMRFERHAFMYGEDVVVWSRSAP